MGLTYGIYSAIEQSRAARESQRSAAGAMYASAAEQGRAAAKEEAARQAAAASKPKEAENPDIDTSSIEDTRRKKRGVKSSYTATGAGAGNLQGTTLSPIGGGDGSKAIAAV